jgi:hypothetical protein
MAAREVISLLDSDGEEAGAPAAGAPPVPPPARRAQGAVDARTSGRRGRDGDEAGDTRAVRGPHLLRLVVSAPQRCCSHAARYAARRRRRCSAPGGARTSRRARAPPRPPCVG